MAKICVTKQEMTAFRIANRCSFLTEEWEREWMWNAILSAFRWAEKTSVEVDPEAPYGIVNVTKRRKPLWI